MPSRLPNRLHPLLLEQGYWRNRLDTANLERQSLLLVPRDDLSSNAKEVVEFRLRSHDGVRLWGLMARPRLRLGLHPAKIRLIGPSELPEIDVEAVKEGWVDLVLQAPAGRRLEDRVLDVLRLAQVARGVDGIDPERVEFDVPERRPGPDEFLIASRLLADGYSC